MPTKTTLNIGCTKLDKQPPGFGRYWNIEVETGSLICKGIKPVNSKGNQSSIFIGRTDAEAEAPILWAPDEKSQLIRKDSDAGENWRQEEKGTTEDNIVGRHHQLNRHEFVQVLGDRWWRTGKLGLLQSTGVTKRWTWLSYWTKVTTTEVETNM